MVGNFRSWTDTTLSITPDLRVTPWHPIFVVDSGRFVDAGKLSDEVLLGPGGQLRRVALQPAPAGYVYDLAVEWPHTYFAGGVLVHNKAAATTRGRQVRQDTWADIDVRPQPRG